MAKRTSNQYIRDRFGGMHVSTAFFGWLVTAGVGALLTGLVAALGGAALLNNQVTGGTLANDVRTASLTAAIVALVIMAIAYYAGGYVAGRLTRIDSNRQGAGVWLMGILVALVVTAIGALVGSSFDLFRQASSMGLSFDASALTVGGLASLLIAAVMSLGAALIGSATGSRYHSRVDEAVAATQRLNTYEPEARPMSAAQQRMAPTFGERIEPAKTRRSRRH